MATDIEKRAGWDFDETFGPALKGLSPVTEKVIDIISGMFCVERDRVQPGARLSYIASELRRLRKENVRLNRKLALQRIGGPVAERDAKTRKVRIELGRDPETDAKILSPWVRVQSTSAGKTKGFVLPSVGEQLYLESASGVVGADSVATYGTFNDTNKHPEQEADESVIFEIGGARLSATKDRVLLKVDGAQLTVTKSKITLGLGGQGFDVTEEALQMLGLFKAKGGSRPAHYKGGKDSGGDTAQDGNDQVLI